MEDSCKEVSGEMHQKLAFQRTNKPLAFALNNVIDALGGMVLVRLNECLAPRFC